MRTPYIVLVGLVVCAASALAQAPAAPPPYRVIVNGKSNVTSIDREFLADVFLKKVTRWPNGEAILPVDLDAHSSVRRKFAEDVLKRQLTAVRQYWQQQIFSGRNVPPPELEGDQPVLDYVAKHKGAIGYVSGGAVLGGVKVINVR
jgi:ABC-type phosphate transport system substrate-binding protein